MLSTKDHIHKLINKPWMSDQDLESLLTILIALPLSRGSLGETLNQIAQQIDSEFMSCLVVEKETHG